jgi:hypothetical protein
MPLGGTRLEGSIGRSEERSGIVLNVQWVILTYSPTWNTDQGTNQGRDASTNQRQHDDSLQTTLEPLFRVVCCRLHTVAAVDHKA